MSIDAGCEAGADAAPNSRLANCQKCVHFFVTWDPLFPRGCRLFGFKTASQPGATVFEATGGKCQNYENKFTIRRP